MRRRGRVDNVLEDLRIPYISVDKPRSWSYKRSSLKVSLSGRARIWGGHFSVRYCLLSCVEARIYLQALRKALLSSTIRASYGEPEVRVPHDLIRNSHEDRTKLCYSHFTKLLR